MKDEEEEWGLTCWQKLRFFMKQSCKDIGRHKCQFCLSFCSVFVVVLSILIVVSITQKGPIIFLRLSEKQVGEYDAIFSSIEQQVENINKWEATYWYLNYTQITGEVLKDDDYNLSPRNVFANTMDGDFEYTVQFIDTNREKEIDLGVKYPFNALNAGECIVNSGARTTDPTLKIGDVMQLNIPMQELFNTIRNQYNDIFREPGHKRVNFDEQYDVVIPCTIVDFMGETYGKYPSSSSDKQIIMEYN